MVCNLQLKPEIKSQWLAALRSGDYKHGVDGLRTMNNEFSVLGVLCNLHAIAHPEVAALERDPELYLGCFSYMPPDVARWAFVHVRQPFNALVSLNTVAAGCSTLLNLNDVATFGEIADIIEAQF